MQAGILTLARVQVELSDQLLMIRMDAVAATRKVERGSHTFTAHTLPNFYLCRKVSGTIYCVQLRYDLLSFRYSFTVL